ncbi:fimbrial protein [Escherichia marmotae]|uniref:F4 family fimbrial subunit n=1 Tax=Escherichia marmotae TaxID=1499973 RepID=UPI002F30C3C8
MKKTLIALAMAVSAVSSAAHAWTSGDFNGSFDIDGTISADTYSDKWEWMIGEPLSFQNTIKEMTEGNKVLTISQEKPVSILLGRTKEAFAAPSVGVGAIPLISFSDSNGTPVSLQDSGENKGFFNLPMKDDSGNALGNVKVNVTTAGLLSFSETRTGYVGVSSVFSNDDSHIYHGGLVSSVTGSGNGASSILSKFGGDNHTALLKQITQVIPDAGKNGQVKQAYANAYDMVLTNGDVMASSYVLGIDQGQTIEATFTNPVTKNTQWSAPLNVAVTYN